MTCSYPMLDIKKFETHNPVARAFQRKGNEHSNLNSISKTLNPKHYTRIPVICVPKSCEDMLISGQVLGISFFGLGSAAKLRAAQTALGAAQLMRKIPLGAKPEETTKKVPPPTEGGISSADGLPKAQSLSTSMVRYEDDDALGRLCYIGMRDEGGWRFGIGTLMWRDGSCYEGEWHADVPHGLGIERMPDGSFYAGQFWNDEREGWGMVTEADGSKAAGEWRGGEIRGVLIAASAGGACMTAHRIQSADGSVDGEGDVTEVEFRRVQSAINDIVQRYAGYRPCARIFFLPTSLGLRA